MTALSTMTPAERSYMARRLPRTFKAMQARLSEDLTQVKRHRTRERLLHFDWDRLQAIKQRTKLSRRNKARPFDRRPTTDQTIVRLLVEHSGHAPNELCSVRRKQSLVHARHAGMWLLRKHTSLSLPQIGRCFGGRDHSTVLHGIRSVDGQAERYAHIIVPIEQALKKDSVDDWRPTDR